jgi:hypothetical protein
MAPPEAEVEVAGRADADRRPAADREAGVAKADDSFDEPDAAVAPAPFPALPAGAASPEAGPVSAGAVGTPDEPVRGWAAGCPVEAESLRERPRSWSEPRRAMATPLAISTRSAQAAAKPTNARRRRSSATCRSCPRLPSPADGPTVTAGARSDKAGDLRCS